MADIIQAPFSTPEQRAQREADEKTAEDIAVMQQQFKNPVISLRYSDICMAVYDDGAVMDAYRISDGKHLFTKKPEGCEYILLMNNWALECKIKKLLLEFAPDRMKLDLPPSFAVSLDE